MTKNPTKERRENSQIIIQHQKTMGEYSCTTYVNISVLPAFGFGRVRLRATSFVTKCRYNI